MGRANLTFPKVRCVIDTSSNLMLNSPARWSKSARILDDTYEDINTDESDVVINLQLHVALWVPQHRIERRCFSELRFQWTATRVHHNPYQGFGRFWVNDPSRVEIEHAVWLKSFVNLSIQSLWICSRSIRWQPWPWTVHVPLAWCAHHIKWHVASQVSKNVSLPRLPTHIWG